MQTEMYMKQMLEKYSDMVYRIALVRCRNRHNAEDIYQDVFVKFSEKMPRFDCEEHAKNWFIRVTLNLTKNMLISNWYTKNVELDENIIFETKEQEDVFSAVNELPNNYRTVIYLLYYEGYKVREISKLINVNENTVKTWLSRAREILKEKLKGGFEDE